MRLGLPLDGRASRPIVGFAGDFPCAWCRLAWHRLRAEADRCGGSVGWLPFQLDPTVPMHGTPYWPWLIQRHGGVAAAEAGVRRVAAAAAADDVRFEIGLIHTQPNSGAAHRLVAAAALADRGVAAVDLLFRAFFEEGQDIGDATILDALARTLCLANRSTPELPTIPLPVTSVGAVPVIVDADGNALVGCQPRETIGMFVDMAVARRVGSDESP